VQNSTFGLAWLILVELQGQNPDTKIKKCSLLFDAHLLGVLLALAFNFRFESTEEVMV
jgi:hypothetical protein